MVKLTLLKDEEGSTEEAVFEDAFISMDPQENEVAIVDSEMLRIDEFPLDRVLEITYKKG